MNLGPFRMICHILYIYVAMEDADSHQKWWVNIYHLSEKTVINQPSHIRLDENKNY